MTHSRKLPVLGHYRVLFEAGSFSGLSDRELLACFLSRDAEAGELAFAAIVERHASAVMRICRATAGNEHDAEDAFQATFLVLATKAGGLGVRESLGPWLSAVAHRVSKGARAVALARTARELRAAALAAGRRSEAAGRVEISSILHEEIDRLPERYRLPLLLCDIENCTQQEAARKLGWPLGTVKSRQARARARLRARLVRRGLHGVVPPVGVFGGAHPPIAESLIHSTARAAAGLLSRGEYGRSVPGSIASLVRHFLRTTIVNRLTNACGIVCLITAGIAATVMAQGQSEPKKPVTDPAATSLPAPGREPVFQYEIRILKDGAPITPTMKLAAQADIPSEFEIPEGTVELRFRPRGASLKNKSPHLKPADPSKLSSVNEELADRLAQEMLDTKLEIIKVEADVKTRENAKHKEREQQIQEEFQRDPEVVALCEEIALADEQRGHARVRSLLLNDPARQAAEEKYKKLRLKYNKLWEDKYVEIRERLRAAGPAPRRAESIEDLKQKLEALKTEQAKQAELFEKLTVEPRKVECLPEELLESIKTLNERLSSALDKGDKAKADDIRDDIRKALKAIYLGKKDRPNRN